MASVLHGRRPRSVRRDTGSKMEGSKGNSRPESPSSVSSKASQKNRDKGPSKSDLLKANSEITREVEALNAENQILKSTISVVIDKLIENAKIKGVKVPPEIENPVISEIPSDKLAQFAEKLTAESHKSSTMEFRVEELETRVTHLNMELAKLLRTRVNIEHGLEDILNGCSDLEDVKKKARGLIWEIKSNNLFTFLDSIPLHDTDEEKCPKEQESQKPLPVQAEKPKKPQPITVVLKDEKLDLTPPVKKMPGDTSIKQMHKDLHQYIVQQLSFTKGNGADWRMMAERIGIPTETIQQWKRWKLELPMQYVLQTWSQSPGATVRMLHRHLVSPQMRSTLLAKRLSDFYSVD